MLWKPPLAAILSLGLLLLTACQSSSLPPGKGSRRSKILVTRDDLTMAPGCRPHAIAERIIAFLDALNEGDPSDVAAFFGSEFRWFSVTGSPEGNQRHFTAYTRRDAIRYATEKVNFNLSLRSVATGSPSPGRGDFAFELGWTKTMNGREALWQVVGKGAINCASKEIDVWSMAVRPHGQEEDTALCPTPSQPARSGVVIACARTS
jgi:hypothetical protein